MMEKRRLLIVDRPSRVSFECFASYDDVSYSSKEDLEHQIHELIFESNSKFFGWYVDVRVGSLTLNNVRKSNRRIHITNRIVTEFDLICQKNKIMHGYVMIPAEGVHKKPWWKIL